MPLDAHGNTISAKDAGAAAKLKEERAAAAARRAAKAAAAAEPPPPPKAKKVKKPTPAEEEELKAIKAKVAKDEGLTVERALCAAGTAVGTSDIGWWCGACQHAPARVIADRDARCE